jgi:hypothetical protein
VPQPYLYTGREYDRATGLYYYRARYYDPETGTFILIHAAARVETATEVAQGAEFVGVGCGGYAIAEPANDNYKDEGQTEDDNPDSRMCKLMGTNDVLNFDNLYNIDQAATYRSCYTAGLLVAGILGHVAG